MGMILPFQPRKPAQRRQTAAPPTPASVVIFPGVRYEQLPGAEPSMLSRRIGELLPRLPSPQRT